MSYFAIKKTNVCPVTNFLIHARPEHRDKFFHIIEQLEEMGPNLPRPYADILHDGIHELRVNLSGSRYRFLYFFCFEKYIIMFLVFVKNTDRVPEKIIRQMIKYREKLLSRNKISDLDQNEPLEDSLL